MSLTLPGRVLGVDPSLTGTGCVLIDIQTRAVVDTWTHTSTGRKGDSLRKRLERIDAIAHDIGVLDNLALVVIEGPSLGQARQSGTFDRAGLWWAIVSRFASFGGAVPVVEVPPASLKKYATGKGNASKDTVLLEVARRYPTVPIANNNEADALVLAAMGLHVTTGDPLVKVPADRLGALLAVTWPAIKAV